MRAEQGFTLIEIMAVLLVIGITVGMVSFSIGSGTRPQEIKAAARTLYNGMNLASEEATYTRTEMGLRIDADTEETVADAHDATPRWRYQWLSYDATRKKWLPSKVEALSAKTLPQGTQLQIEVDGQTITVGAHSNEAEFFALDASSRDKQEKKKDPKKVEIHPDIYFFSSGETQDFTVALSDSATPDSRYRITGNLLGQIRFKRPDEPDDDESQDDK